jgi:hypothetical protein
LLSHSASRVCALPKNSRPPDIRSLSYPSFASITELQSVKQTRRFPTVFNPTLQIIFFAAQIYPAGIFLKNVEFFYTEVYTELKDRLVECGYFWAAKKELTVSVTVCHFTGPIALRHRLSAVLPLSSGLLQVPV